MPAAGEFFSIFVMSHIILWRIFHDSMTFRVPILTQDSRIFQVFSRFFQVFSHFPWLISDIPWPSKIIEIPYRFHTFFQVKQNSIPIPYFSGIPWPVATLIRAIALFSEKKTTLKIILENFCHRKSQFLAFFPHILIIFTYLSCNWVILNAIFGIYRQFCIGNGLLGFFLVKILASRLFEHRRDSN